MALTAEYIDTEGEQGIVDITDYDTPRLALAGWELRCPECKEPMHVYQSLIRLSHFKHNPGRAHRDCALAQGEGAEHIAAKIAVAKKISSMSIYRGSRVVKEHWLPDVSRRADICVIDPSGFEVHEIQLASITIDSLESRTNDYAEAGAREIVWWFGENANTEQNRLWAKKRLGGYGEINITDGVDTVL